MSGDKNGATASYKGPQGAFEKRLCKMLFAAVVKTPHIIVDFGDGAASSSDDKAEFVLAPPSLWPTLKVLFAPGFNIGDTYVSGEWFLRKGALCDFLFLMRKQAPPLYGSYYRFVSKLKGLRYYLEQYIFTRYFTRQVQEHYDLDSTLGKMILGEELIYTCGFFDTDETTLSEAQQKKTAVILSRLHLADGQTHILDLGCGWGALERTLVRANPEAKICGLSIARSQIEWAQTQAEQTLPSSLASRIEYRLEDFADHSRFGYYDAVSVVGMMEHVGLSGYREFFGRIEKFLKPGGTALLHTVLAPLSSIPSNRWIDRRIFVGGHIPSLVDIARSLESTMLSVTDIYLHSPKHYRRTLECWLENLIANHVPFCDYLRAQGIAPEQAERAFRTWQFYLSAVRNMFDPDAPHSHQIVHICLNKKL